MQTRIRQLDTKEKIHAGEFELFRRLISDVYPKGIVSIVSDTFDFWKVITEYVPALKSEILARSGGYPVDKVVIRPDSGDPVKIICGDPEVDPNSPQGKGAIECLWETFGGTITSKGYKLLDSHIGLIYGDSITPQRAEAIMKGLEAKGFCSGNVVLGIGSYTYQHVTRDTYGFAVKATYGEVNGEAREIFKDPITDNGSKKSHRGLLKVTKEPSGLFEVHQQVTWSQTMDANNLHKPVFKDGVLLVDFSLDEIRKRVLGLQDGSSASPVAAVSG